MKGEILFEKMTNISDEYINEAAMGEAYGNPRRDREDSALSRLLNSGWFVATVCAVISLCVVVALVRWGQAGDPTEPPVGPAGSTPPVSSSRFEFSYELFDAQGNPLTAPVTPGDFIAIKATVINRGLPFLYSGSSWEFCPDVRLIHEGEDKTTVLHGEFAHIEDFGTFLVKTGEVGLAPCEVYFPDDAPEGVYDLVLSYKDAEQVFVGAVRVEDHSQKEPESETESETQTEPETAPEPETEPAPLEIPVLDDATRSYLRNAYAAAHPSVIPSDISISPYYGTFPSGAIVAMIADGQSDVHCAMWEEPVGSYLIPYNDGSRIEVCFNEAFYTLTEAYRNGFLSDADVAVIHALQCEYGGFVNNGPTFDREATYDREDSFGFVYNVIDGVFLPGESIQVRVFMRNQMICDYEWVGSSSEFMPQVKFVLTTDTEYVITPLDPALSDDVAYNIVARAETRYRDYFFTIPTDAPPGQYHLVCSFRNSQQTFVGEDAEFWFE